MNDKKEVVNRLPASRPLLLFNHNAKAGGSSILNLLREFKFCEIQVKTNDGPIEDDLLLKKYNNLLLQKLQKSDTNSSVIDSQDCFVHIKENKGSTFDDRYAGFIIGSIREPCSHFLSWWSWKSDGGSGLYPSRKSPNITKFLGKDAPYYNSTRDIQRFRKWIKQPGIRGQVEYHFRHNYGAPPVGADCLVIVEDFSNSLLHCLQMYEQQGGFVNWDSPLVAGLVHNKEEEEKSAHRRKVEEKQERNGTDDPLTNEQWRHHASCTTYYTPNLATQIEEGPEKELYKHFGYTGCCSSQFDHSTIYGSTYASTTISGVAVTTKGEEYNSSSDKRITLLFCLMFCAGLFWALRKIKRTKREKKTKYLSN